MKKRAINKVKLEFPSKSVNEGFARAAAAAFASQLDPTIEELADIKTAVSEAVTNAVVHAYPETPGLVAMVLTLYEDGYIEVIVKDRGVGIEDVARAREPAYTTGGDDRSGMGFTIMESFMGSLKVTSKPGSGTTVRMVKRVMPSGK